MPIETLQTSRLYQQIAGRIAQMIAEGELAPGDRLPGEHDLARRFGVSRPSIREAMIALEMTGLIEVRTGSGAYVLPSPSEQRRRARIAIGEAGPGPLEQFKARVLLEPELAAEAARNASAEEIDELERITDRIEQAIRADPHVHGEHYLFHEKLAEASHNSVLAGFFADLIRMMQEPLWQVTRLRVDTPEGLQAGLASRRRVIDCLRRHDADGARAAMREHLRRVGKLFFGDTLEEGAAELAQARSGRQPL